MRIRWPYLDLARGMAAMVVAMTHLRAFIFVDFHTSGRPGLMWSAFYFATGFGHEAVMAFFVLSGFLVGGSVLSQSKAKQWSWSDYAVTRLTRLWIVLLPALLLTAFWDHLGMALTGSAFYKGGMIGLYHSAPAPDASRYDIASFVGNFAFLQTIVVPTFGSNGPLWSLADEFWYYVLFPMWFCAFTKAKTNAKVGSALIALIISYALPAGLLLYGLIWLFGAAASALSNKVMLSRQHRNFFIVLSGIALAIALTLSRTSKLQGLAADSAIGASFAAMLVPISQIRQANPILVKLSRASADFSYTLYLIHFPIATFFACYVLDNRRLMPNLTSAVVYICFLVSILLYSYGMYFLFERNTPTVRRAILRLEVAPVV